MAAPYRINRPGSPVGGAAEDLDVAELPMGGGDELPITGGGSEAPGGFAGYLDRLMKMIPAEAIGLYIVGKGIVNDQAGILVGWAVFCLLFVILLRVKYTADPARKLPPDWLHIAISSVAFLIWIYSMGDPWEAFNIYNPAIGSLLVLAYTAVVPVLYKGPGEA